MFSGVLGNRVISLHAVYGGITRLPPEIGTLDKLEVLMLLGGKTPLTAAPEISRLQGLRRINVGGFPMDNLPDWIFSFPRLASLELSSLRLREFPGQAMSLPWLEFLYLGYNQIPDIPPSIRKAGRLRTLAMDHNRLSFLPPELMGMQSLQGFRARFNQLCSLGTVEKDWVLERDSVYLAQQLRVSRRPDTVGIWESQTCPPGDTP